MSIIINENKIKVNNRLVNEKILIRTIANDREGMVTSTGFKTINLNYRAFFYSDWQEKKTKATSIIIDNLSQNRQILVDVNEVLNFENITAYDLFINQQFAKIIKADLKLINTDFTIE